MKSAAKQRRAKKAVYWYRFYYGECPVCGKDKSYKERVYGPKPKDMKERIKYLPDTETYDDCIG